MRSVYDILDLIKHVSNESPLNDLRWKGVFVDFFVNDSDDGETEGEDDLLFFVSRPINKRLKENLQVRRRFASNLPLDSPWINWEESFFLNLILHKLQYSVLFSICTRTSEEHYQVLSKTIVPVYATPSYHSVVYKESIEEYSYPFINFNIENFEDFFYGNILNDLESIHVELLVKANNEHEPFVLFSASVNYQTIDDAYCSKKLFSNQTYKYFGVLRVNSAESEGSAEVVFKKKIKRSLSDNSNTSIFMNDGEDMPDQSLQFYLLNINRSRLKNHNFYSSNNLLTKDYVYTIQSENFFSNLSNHTMNDSFLVKLWKKPGFTQSYFDWKVKQRQQSNSFHCFLSNITIPWNHIIAQLIANKKHRSIFIL